VNNGMTSATAANDASSHVPSSFACVALAFSPGFLLPPLKSIMLRFPRATLRRFRSCLRMAPFFIFACDLWRWTLNAAVSASTVFLRRRTGRL
jgi:hypothetical protein